ncbi:MAG TPA: oxidoreductase [Bacteroidales bacterium]|nr:oxidoreductase [Bacteroidales bacterium]
MTSWNEIPYDIQQVISNTAIAPGAYILKFKKNNPFIAGQVLALGVTKDIEPRYYSIVSVENDELISILYTERVEGKLTPTLSLLKPGDNIMVSKPFETFTQVKPSPVFSVAGMGIVPFMSMLLSGKAKGATLIHGAHYPKYFYYSNILTNTLGVNYIRCCSRCQPGCLFVGRVTDFVKQWNDLDVNRPYYLCGSAEMVVETRDILISRGVPVSNINSELYF